MRARHPSMDLPALDLATAWSLLGEPVDDVEPIGEGTRSRVYRVTLSDGGTRVVRIGPRGTGRVAREAWVRARMAGTAAPTVAAVSVTHPTLSLHADVVLMHELPGASLEAALAGATDEGAERLWCAFGEGLAAFHAVPVEGFGLLDGAGRGAFRTWRAAMEHAASEALRDARATELHDLCDRAEEALARDAPGLDAVTSARLTHGDAQPSNVQCAGGRIVAWLDLEYASGADPLYELAFVARFFEAPVGGGSDLRRARAMEGFTRGYTARFTPVAADEGRLAHYRVTHALRTAEMLRVMDLDDPQRAAAVAFARGRLEAALTRS
jgi:Ser/Thr protein kinase RdoA (MazF antagonist)